MMKAFISGSAASLAGVVLIGIMSYLLRRTLALSLSPESYGFLYGAISLATLAFLVTELGMGQAISIETAKAAAEGELGRARRLFSSLWHAKALLSLAAFAALLAASPWLLKGGAPEGYGIGVTALILFLCVLYNLEALERGALLGLKGYATSAALEFAKALATLLVAIALVGRLGLYAPALGLGFGVLLNCVAMLLILKRRGLGLQGFRRPEAGWADRSAKLLGWIALSSACLAVPGQLDSIALMLFKGSESVGAYNIAIPIMQIAQGVFMIFPAVFLPMSAELWSKGETGHLKRICRWALALGILGALGAFGSLWLLGRFLIGLLFAARFESAAPAAAILTSGAVLFALASFLVQTLNSGGRQREAFLVCLGALAADIACHLTLTPLLGVEGAALSTLVAYAALCLFAFLKLETAFKANA